MLQDIKECWMQLEGFRRNRNRCRDYTFGRQWNDTIEIEGRKISEYEYIVKEGNVPLKNNLIRRIVRNVIGVFRERLTDYMKESYEKELHVIVESNSLEEMFARTMEEFLISGMAIHKKRIGLIAGKPGVLTESVSPGNFFFNTDSRDIRGFDLSIVGQFYSLDFQDWCRAFVKDNSDLRYARKIFEGGRRRVSVAEAWRREFVPRYLVHFPDEGTVRYVSEQDGAATSLPKKWELCEVWRYYYIQEDGTLLAEGDSPYVHGSHPYVTKFYPFLDGEIHSFVGDMIDQQRYTNRLITLYDWVIRASAKGVLLLPEGAVDPRDIQGVADQWGRFNGVIVYKADPSNPEPKQISGNLSNLGISELLEIQLKMLEDVSGVNWILQGNTNGGNVSGELYNSQTANAMYSLSDLMETYRVFIRENAKKDRALAGQINEKIVI